MLTIEPVRPDDLSQTAELHNAHLKMGLFPRLGRSFLRRYQRTFAESPFGIALAARQEGRIVGALFGTTSNADHYRWVVRNRGWELARAGASALLVRPALAWTFASTRIVRYARGLGRHILPASAETPPASPGQAAPLSVLSHIVTGETERRRGIGRSLVAEFKRQARAAGARRAMLVTEEGGLGAPFFERIGGICVNHREGQDGLAVREYRLQLDEAERYETTGTRRRSRDFIGAYPHLHVLAARRFHHAATGARAN